MSAGPGDGPSPGHSSTELRCPSDRRPVDVALAWTDIGVLALPRTTDAMPSTQDPLAAYLDWSATEFLDPPFASGVHASERSRRVWLLVNGVAWTRPIILSTVVHMAKKAEILGV